jgi:hypothetical protein
MSDYNVFLVFCVLVLAALLHLSGRRVVFAERDAKRWAQRCRHATLRAKRRGRELRARDVAAQRRNAKKQEAAGHTWDDIENIFVSSR